MGRLARVYVANRGEIACRVIRALRARGLEAVVGYSDADAGAPFVKLADRAVRLGPAPAAQSYLDIGRVIDAARGLGADAVHPGYGFLSERPAFAAAVEGAGMVFVGPTAATMDRLGDKVKGREAAQKAGVPVLPGTREPVDAAGAAAAARGIGYPLLVKAAAGGGGKGMRQVGAEAELAAAVESATREATAAFGDGRVFLERFLPSPRHIEIQVMGDGRGQVLHFGERECSLQRRHQKVIEEAPGPVSPGLRARMGAAAVELCRAVEYRGAGTCEFLVQGDEFFFLEMNTRIQVEHPVTELVTGTDLVGLQLAVAAGQGLGLAQEDLALKGHAIEARLCAEDPARGYLPSPGEVLALELPTGPGIRVDCGIAAGGAIPEHYDNMVAKVIAWGPDRETARRRLVLALEETVVLGPTTNQAWLLALLEHPGFVARDCHVRCIDGWMAGWKPPGRGRDAALAVAARVGLAGERTPAAGGGTGPVRRSPFDSLGAVRL